MPVEPYRDIAPAVAAGVFLHASAQIIGDVTLGEDSSVWCNAVVRGDVNRIVIGRATSIQDLSMCHVTHKSAKKPAGSPLVIGDYVTIGHAAILHGCTIGNECLVGMGSIVMDDAVLEDRVMLSAGSLVPPGKRLESGWLYVGRPVSALRRLSDEEMAFLRYSAEHYVRLKNSYLGSSGT